MSKRPHNQRFSDAYEKQWPVLKRSKKSETHAYCSVCDIDFAIAHGGLSDCKRHIACRRHLDNAKVKASNRTLTSSFVSMSEDVRVIRAETLFTAFIIEHNLPISVADHARPLFIKMFPDSDIAKKYGCARTKTTAIINSMADGTAHEMTEILKTSKFSLATDASNTNAAEKIFPVVVSYLDTTVGKIIPRLLSLPKLDGDATGENMFKLLDTELGKKSIPWHNCIAFSSDNASSMVGKYKGVTKFLREKNPNMVIHGCTCHLLHLAAKRGAKELKIDVEDFVIDIYYFLHKSTKRIEAFKMCQKVCNLESHKIIKYVCTRWLSLDQVINRFLEQWESLEKYFGEENMTTQGCEKYFSIQKRIGSPETKLYLLFLQQALPLFCKTNILLQNESPIVHRLHRELISLLSELMARFIKPSAVVQAENVLTIPISDRKNQKSDEELVIGSKTRQYLNNSNLSKNEVISFYRCVRLYYQKCCEYMLKKFQLNDQVLLHAEVADVRLRTSSKFCSVNYFVDLFGDFSDEENNLLEVEFARFQVDKLNCDIVNCEQSDQAWSLIKELKDHNGDLKYKVLPLLMHRILLIPHSNAACERVFSTVRKNQNDFRSNLSVHMLQSLLVEKSRMAAHNLSCHQHNFTTEVLMKAKKATALVLKKDQ